MFWHFVHVTTFCTCFDAKKITSPQDFYGPVLISVWRCWWWCGWIWNMYKWCDCIICTTTTNFIMYTIIWFVWFCWWWIDWIEWMWWWWWWCWRYAHKKSNSDYKKNNNKTVNKIEKEEDLNVLSHTNWLFWLSKWVFLWFVKDI